MPVCHDKLKALSTVSLTTIGQKAHGNRVLQSAHSNRRIALASRPVGAPSQEHFLLEQTDVPKPGPGEVLV